MPLTVLSVGYPLAPVSQTTAGGAEHILATLDEALVKAGHRSLVIAPEGSRCRGTLLPVATPKDNFDDAAREFAWVQFRSAITSALAKHPVDVIHMHGLDFLQYLPDAGVPVIATLHLPPNWYPSEVFKLSRPHTHLVCVSESQARECPRRPSGMRVIPNGVCLDNLHPGWTKGNYIFALGRICPEKGFHLALDAASQCGIPMLLAGQVFDYETHRQYFETMIRPRLNEQNRFLGAIGGRRKQQLLAGARCLVVSSLVPETSCLVAMEAIACGTPVVALRRGALPEIVEHGRTGFLVDSPSQLTGAILASGNLSSSLCRESAEKKFPADRMIRDYLSLYQEIGNLRRELAVSSYQEVA